VISITVAPALVGAGMDAAANPDFGSPQFMWHLQQDVGMIDRGASPKRPCPTVRGVPVPPTWGYKWRPENEWMRYIDRHGHPPDREHAAGRETPDQKWHKTVKRYRAFLVNHPYTGWSGWHVKHDHFVQYLEQNWYNYWHRLRYGSNPPNHDSHYHGWGYGREGW
jgi:hypothetical protein